MPTHYESDFTQFIKDLKTKKPELELQQRESRARLWDRTLNLDEWARFRASRVPQQPYVYQSTPRP